jgi:hypothetical protein
MEVIAVSMLQNHVAASVPDFQKINLVCEKKSLREKCEKIDQKKINWYMQNWASLFLQHLGKHSKQFFSSLIWCYTGMSLTKLSLAGNYLIIPGQGEFGKWHPAWGRENRYIFYSVYGWPRMGITLRSHVDRRTAAEVWAASAQSQLKGLANENFDFS